MKENVFNKFEMIEIPSLKDLQINIFESDNIKELLETYLSLAKANDKKFSNRFFNLEVLGTSAPGYLSLVFQKKNKFSDDIVDKLLEIFKTSNEESEYLYLLTKLWDLEAHYVLSESFYEKDSFYKKLTKTEKEQLDSIKSAIYLSQQQLIQSIEESVEKKLTASQITELKNHITIGGKDSSLYKVLSKRYDTLREGATPVVFLKTWGHLLIYRLIKHLKTQQVSHEKLIDPHYLRSILEDHIGLSPAEIKKCLEDLMKEGVLIVEKEHVELNTNWNISSDFSWVKQYHLDVLDQAIKSIETASTLREYQTVFIPTTKDNILKIKNLIEVNKEQIREQTATDDGELLMSLSWQLFPVTNATKKEKG